MSSITSGEVPATPQFKKPKKAVGPKLKILLMVVFGLVALLGANSAYLSTITFAGWVRGSEYIYENWFYPWMFLAHLVLGLLLVLPLIIFGLIHMANSWNSKKRRAVKLGYALFICSIVVLVSGIALMRPSGTGPDQRIGSLFELKSPTTRNMVYWLHFITPLMAVWLYWLHRLAGTRIKWRIGISYAGAVAAACVAIVFMQSIDPRKSTRIGPKEGEKYFFPSLARTGDGNFVHADTLMMDSYCLKCHQDAYKGWFHSAHHFSSFNNPAYMAAVRETRDFSMKVQKDVKRSRWCAGCHDPVPFFSGAFDDPNFDVVKHPTSQAGITCTVCHAITAINDVRGNGNFTIEEPIHYPFAKSDNAMLQWVNNQLVKAKPSFHKKTFLKPEVHRNSEFCSTCHKVHLPPELNDYKWLRGQNHYDTFLLSGVSGHGSRSFYYPDKAKENCASCHMPLQTSIDFGAKGKEFGAEKPSIHDHLFPAANTGLAHLRPDEAYKGGLGMTPEQVINAHQDFLKDVMRVDIFGVREDGAIDGKLIAPLRPNVPTLKPGGKYLLEAVVRTLKMGHPFTQGTVDSNEVWLEVKVTSGDKVIGRSGALDDKNEVDPWSPFLNVFMLDREGNRIARRNPQDIFVPLYNNQIPPGAAATVHYELNIPEKLSAPVTVEVKLNYRKFDKQYMDFVTGTAKPGDNPIRSFTPGKPYLNDLPITVLAVDKLTLPVAGVAVEVKNEPSKIPPWQRWNDFGIGLLLKGKAQLVQAAEAFKEVEKLNRFDGPLNLARVHFTEGQLDEATAALARAETYQSAQNTAPAWTMNWLRGLINRQQAHLPAAERNFRAVVTDPPTTAMKARGFDFTKDYEVINELGFTLFEMAEQARGEDARETRENLHKEAVAQFLRTLALDPENVPAHYNLQLLYAKMGQKQKSEEHQKLHSRYKLDDNARDKAFANARAKYPAANAAAEPTNIFKLNRTGAPGLAEEKKQPDDRRNIAAGR